MFEALRIRKSHGVERKEADVESTLETSELAFTGRIASWSARHRWWVVAASVMMLVLAVLASSTFKVKLLDADEIAEGESGEAIRLLDERFGEGGVSSEQLVFSHPSLDVSDPDYRSTVERLVQELRAMPEVSAVVSYYETGDPRLVSADRHVLRTQVELADTAASDNEQIDAILDTVYGARPEASASGFYIGMAGDLSVLKQVDDLSEEDLGRVLIVTLVLALVMLLLVFRAVVAALIPLALAMGAISTAMGIAALVSQAYPMADGYDILISMLGLAVGIDYSLFIISRFRYERQAGREKLEAITVASNTTGRAVFYARHYRGGVADRNGPDEQPCLHLHGPGRHPGGASHHRRLPHLPSGGPFPAGRQRESAAGPAPGEGQRQRRNLERHHQAGSGTASHLCHRRGRGAGRPGSTGCLPGNGLPLRLASPS